MNAGNCPRSVLILVALLVRVLASPAPGQELENVIPKNQKPIARMFPPAAGEQTKSGTGKFVIFTRESVGTTGQWDFIAGAWECIPSRPEIPVTKRVEFCHSSWEAGPLLGTLSSDDSEGMHPRFVRLQVKSGDGDNAVNLYDINYRTWEVKCLWQGARLSGFGVAGDKIFCDNQDDWFQLDARSGAISKDVPFTPLGADGQFWLVRKPGEKNGCWSYHRGEQKFVAHFASVPKAVYADSVLSPDGRCRAWVVADMPREWLAGRIRSGTISGRLILQRADLSEDIAVPIEMNAVAGSGEPVIPLGTDLTFSPDGKVEFRAQKTDKQEEDRMWTIELATGKVSTGVSPHPADVPETHEVVDGVPAPDYLRPLLGKLWHFGRAGLAPAFLMHQGILTQQPEFPDCEAGVSRDGRHVLYRAKKGPLAGVFIYGDLLTKQTVRWPSPDAINPADSLTMLWVESP